MREYDARIGRGGRKDTRRERDATPKGRLIEGRLTTNGKQVLAQLAIAYPDR